MQEIKTAILKEQKTTARCIGKKAASFLLVGGIRRDEKRHQLLFEPLVQAFTISSREGGLREGGGPQCWRQHMLMLPVTCCRCCCCLRIPWFSYLPIRNLGMRKDGYYGIQPSGAMFSRCSRWR